jgi:hypothetical protein
MKKKRRFPANFHSQKPSQTNDETTWYFKTEIIMEITRISYNGKIRPVL